MKQYTVYIMSNHTNSVLYTGSTSQPEIRFNKHHDGFYANAFTKKYNIYKVLWLQHFASAQEMVQAERKIKGWRRSKKLNLIREINPNFENLIRTN